MLSDEDRRRIYEEEKEREAVRERLKTEKPVSAGQAFAQLGCGIIQLCFGVALILFAATIIWAAFAGR